MKGPQPLTNTFNFPRRYILLHGYIPGYNVWGCILNMRETMLCTPSHYTIYKKIFASLETYGARNITSSTLGSRYDNNITIIVDTIYLRLLYTEEILWGIGSK